MNIKMKTSPFLLSFLFSNSGHATAVAFSNFDTGTDGWTWTTENDSPFRWDADDGYIIFDDNVHTNIVSAGVSAPSSFLGDWAALGVTELSFDFNVLDLGVVKEGLTPTSNVLISSASGEAVWSQPISNPNAVNLSPKSSGPLILGLKTGYLDLL